MGVASKAVAEYLLKNHTQNNLCTPMTLLNSKCSCVNLCSLIAVNKRMSPNYNYYAFVLVTKMSLLLNITKVS